MSFAGHFLGLMKYRRIDMRLTVLPALEIKPESSRDTLMDAAFSAISGQYRPIV
jgi:hypothetical protein